MNAVKDPVFAAAMRAQPKVYADERVSRHPCDCGGRVLISSGTYVVRWRCIDCGARGSQELPQ